MKQKVGRYVRWTFIFEIPFNKHKENSTTYSLLPSWGDIFYNSLHEEALSSQKAYLFQALGIHKKGHRFHYLKYNCTQSINQQLYLFKATKGGLGKLPFQNDIERPKRANRRILGLWKSRENVLISTPCTKKGYHLSMEGIRKEDPPPPPPQDPFR